MGIRITTKNKPATAKLYSQIASYLFEQECGEFRGGNIKALQGALIELQRIINKK